MTVDTFESASLLCATTSETRPQPHSLASPPLAHDQTHRLTGPSTQYRLHGRVLSGLTV